MKPIDLEKLYAAFSEQMTKVVQHGNCLMARGEARDIGPSDSFDTISWDNYFRDLSFGSFRKYWDGDKYVSRRRAWHYLFKNLKLIERIFELPTTEVRLLDVGCASGYLRRFIEGNASPNEAKRIFYWGVDVRESVLKKAVTATTDIESGAAGNFSPAAFVHHDTRDGLPFCGAFFDVVVCFQMLKYLPIFQAKDLLCEFRRVVQPGGSAFISTDTDYRYYRSKKKYEGFAITLSPQELVQLLITWTRKTVH